MDNREDPPKKKEFQKKTDEDIDSFLSRSEFSKTQAPLKSPPSYQQTPMPSPTPSQSPEPQTKPTGQEEKHETTDAEHEDQIRDARSGRAEADAYRDVAVLRKKAHAYGHKAAKFYHKYRANEAKAQKCQARAVAFREKAGLSREKARGFRDREKEYEVELSGAAQGRTELNPESVRTKMATMARKSAKQEEVGKRNESKAASQTAKAAKFKSRAAKFLEQNKLLESQARRYAKRADNLEKAGV
jgi:hypothetical protein